MGSDNSAWWVPGPKRLGYSGVQQRGQLSLTASGGAALSGVLKGEEVLDG